MKNLIINNLNTYNELAQKYEKLANVRLNFNKILINDFAKYIEGKEILDIGCAIGIDTNILSSLGFKVIGIDISSEMLKYAKKRNPQIDFICSNFLKYKFEQNV